MNFSASPTSGPGPLNVAFTNTTTGAVTTWAWNFGDGTTSNVQNPTHVYSTKGSYTVMLTATGAGGTASKTATTAIVVSVTTSGTPAAGLVAAYSFSEGAGTAVADASGTGNTGTVQNATWTTAGKYGNALVFNGTNALLTIPDSASLRLTTGMTLEAWVNPSTVSSAWRDVIFKGDDNHYMEATSATAECRQREPSVRSTEWRRWRRMRSHLALTYDKARYACTSMGCKYRASRRRAASPRGNPLQIGGAASTANTSREASTKYGCITAP